MESSIAVFLMRWSACELLPTSRVTTCATWFENHTWYYGNNVPRRDLIAESTPVKTVASTVLAQDHFYSDFLSLSLTILTHKGSMRMILIRCGLESALASATGGMNKCTVDYLNGSTFVMNRLWCELRPTWKTIKNSDTITDSNGMEKSSSIGNVFEST